MKNKKNAQKKITVKDLARVKGGQRYLLAKSSNGTKGGSSTAAKPSSTLIFPVVR